MAKGQTIKGGAHYAPPPNLSVCLSPIPSQPPPALPPVGRYLGQMLFRSKAQAIDRVGSAVCPLAELLRGFCEGHVGRDGTVDNGLGERVKREVSSRESWCPAKSRNQSGAMRNHGGADPLTLSPHTHPLPGYCKLLRSLL